MTTPMYNPAHSHAARIVFPNLLYRYDPDECQWYSPAATGPARRTPRNDVPYLAVQSWLFDELIDSADIPCDFDYPWFLGVFEFLQLMASYPSKPDARRTPRNE